MEYKDANKISTLFVQVFGWRQENTQSGDPVLMRPDAGLSPRFLFRVPACFKKMKTVYKFPVFPV